MVRPDTIRTRRADVALAEAERLRDLLDEARSMPLRDAPTVDADRAQQLVSEVRTSRSAR